MDPDKALKTLLDTARWLRERHDEDGPDYHPDHEMVGELLDAIEALDGWLRKGGFLPKRWAAKRKP